uniref:Transmembrane serine protease 7 n=1 Tax=Malurus cyaneus samueli TaxID=2593467 RepID=A0A8C5TKE2_9PASS
MYTTVRLSVTSLQNNDWTTLFLKYMSNLHTHFPCIIPIEGEWPWQVSLHFVGAAYCGASVISKEWLVSAAHCFQGSKSVPHNLRERDMVVMRSIRRIIVHPQYDQSVSDYDIALLEMETPVLFSELVQPICLPIESTPHEEFCLSVAWRVSCIGEAGKKKHTELEGSGGGVCRIFALSQH